MHFSFNLLRVKSLYMFQALLAHPQEAMHKWHLVYCVHIMSVGCATTAVKLWFLMYQELTGTALKRGSIGLSQGMENLKESGRCYMTFNTVCFYQWEAYDKAF
jgi:hypothetical protein